MKIWRHRPSYNYVALLRFRNIFKKAPIVMLQLSSKSIWIFLQTYLLGKKIEFRFFCVSLRIHRLGTCFLIDKSSCQSLASVQAETVFSIDWKVQKLLLFSYRIPWTTKNIKWLINQSQNNVVWLKGYVTMWYVLWHYVFIPLYMLIVGLCTEVWERSKVREVDWRGVVRGDGGGTVFTATFVMLYIWLKLWGHL